MSQVLLIVSNSMGSRHKRPNTAYAPRQHIHKHSNLSTTHHYIISPTATTRISCESYYCNYYSWLVLFFLLPNTAKENYVFLIAVQTHIILSFPHTLSPAVSQLSFYSQLCWLWRGFKETGESQPRATYSLFWELSCLKKEEVLPFFYKLFFTTFTFPAARGS